MPLRPLAALLLLLVLAAFAPVAAGEVPPDVATLRQRVTELEAEVAALRQRSVTFKALADSGIELMAGGHVDDEVAGVSAQVADLLGMNAGERAQVKAAIDQAYARLAAQIAALKPVTVAISGGIMLVIQDFGAEGKSIEGELHKAIKAAVGIDRQRLLKRLMRSNDRRFLGFGIGTQTISITRQGDHWYYEHETRGDGHSGTYGSGLGNSLARFPLIRPYLPKELIEAIEGPAAPAQPAAPKGADDF